MSYEDMQLSQPVLDAIARLGFEKPTPIQEKSIPEILKGRDMLGQSETGSGKTAAFGIPIAERCEPGKGIQALIVSPTRELVGQITDVMRKLTAVKRLRCLAVYGGVGIGPQIEGLARCEIVIGTPGRLLDHLERGTINLSKVRFVVLDEADKMFEMGFIEDVERLLSAVPKHRQTLLFSATLRSDIREMADRHMRQPITIKTKEYVAESQLRQEFYAIRKNMKLSLLVHLLRHESPSLAMVFCGTRREVDFVERILKANDVNAAALHGGLTQAKRNQVTEHFRKANIHVLVATDVAARGLDISGVSHIVNYSIPKTAKEYIHRIGRTARIGNTGKAISLLDESDHDNFREVQSDRSLHIEEMPVPRIEYIRVDRPSPQRRRHPGDYGRGASRGEREPRSWGHREPHPRREHGGHDQERHDRGHRDQHHASGHAGHGGPTFGRLR